MDKKRPYVITPMNRVDDLDDVLTIEASSFTNPWTRQMFIQTLDRSPGSQIFVSRLLDSPITSYCVRQLVIDELHIHILAVHQRWRGIGLGGYLLRWVLDEAARRGAKTASLEVRSSNMAARHLYESEGFIQFGVRQNYYLDPNEDALIYSRPYTGCDVSARFLPTCSWALSLLERPRSL